MATGNIDRGPKAWVAGLFFSWVFFWGTAEQCGAQAPKNYAVQASATVQVSPPRIALNWVGDTNAVSYALYRKTLRASSWSSLGTLPGTSTSFSDTAVSVGDAYEYKIEKTTGANYFGYGYIYAGVNAPLVENRGKIILIVENLYAADLAAELVRLQQDLVGDGWAVVRRDVSRNDSPPMVKAVIKSEYAADPANVKAVFLFGRVPVAYSGNMAPDGHLNHIGAWPADVYYGNMSGTWTDSSVTTTNAEQTRNWNVPGDGKFDQSDPPSTVELAVGRVDLANMTCFSNKTPSRDERDLLRQYLNKDHNFRHRIFSVPRRAYLTDNFVDTGADPVACNGWRDFPAFFGPGSIIEAGPNNFFPTLKSQGCLWAYGSGGGQFYTSYGTGSSDDFATNDAQVVFTMFMGSYFGDWDTESNFLRAPLGSTTYTLTCTYSGYPQTLYHPMGLGETMGACVRLTQNNTSNGTYFAQYGTHRVHIALMGDPTLRMHPVLPPSNLVGVGGGAAGLSWNPSGDTNLLGYHVYRAASASGPFTRLTSGGPTTARSYSDSPGAGTFTYMVRALKLEQSGSGTYSNSSQGIFVTVSTTGGAPALQSATLLNPQFPGSQFRCLLMGQAGQNFVIDASADLKIWQPIFTNTFGNTNYSYGDGAAGGFGRRFYRARTVP